MIVLTIWTSVPGGGGLLPEKLWMGVCGPFLKSRILFTTEFCDFSCLVDELTVITVAAATVA